MPQYCWSLEVEKGMDGVLDKVVDMVVDRLMVVGWTRNMVGDSGFVVC